MLEHKVAPIALDAKGVKEEDDCYVISGFASVFGNVDLGNDVVMPGAFTESLQKHGLPLMLWQHKMDEAPLGVVTEARENSRGLWFKAELPKDDDLVRGRVVPQLRRRGLKGVSIGYKAIESERRKSDGARLLKKVRLWEISLVTAPMNPEANVETVKAAVDPTGEFAAALREFADVARAIDPAASLRQALREFVGAVR